MRFYKGAGNNGTHTGSLWTASGTLLATGTFTNETASGWQTLMFANPVQISANTVYVAALLRSRRLLRGDLSQFYPTTTGSTDLAARQPAAARGVRSNGSVGNGVFNCGGPGFPTSTYQGTGYGVDVIFDTTQPPGAAARGHRSDSLPGFVEQPGERRPDRDVQQGRRAEHALVHPDRLGGQRAGHRVVQPDRHGRHVHPGNRASRGHHGYGHRKRRATDHFGQVMTSVTNTLHHRAGDPAGRHVPVQHLA